RSGLWLEQRRFRIALWIAFVEALIVLFSHNLTKWTVIALAIVSVFAWYVGRDNRSQVLRNVLWILAASQLLAVIAVPLGWVFKWAVIGAVILFGVGGFFYLFTEHRR